MKVIIFGANGQDAYYLSELLIAQQFEIIKVGRGSNEMGIELHDYESLCRILKSETISFIFHLAANSTTRHDALFENHATISTGTINILEAVRSFSPTTKVFISGSGLQFVNRDFPIKETDDFDARDAYSVSRIHSVYAARYFRRMGLKVYVGYFFNHDSPRRTERHMSKKIAVAAKRIAGGSKEKLEIGDISVIKEWAYAGDVVKAIWTLIQQDKCFEANLGSGLGYSIEDWLKECFTLVGEDWKKHVVLKDNFIPEYKSLVSDPSLIFSLGWAPEISFKQLAEMMVTQ